MLARLTDAEPNGSFLVTKKPPRDVQIQKLETASFVVEKELRKQSKQVPVTAFQPVYFLPPTLGKRYTNLAKERAPKCTDVHRHLTIQGRKRSSFLDLLLLEDNQESLYIFWHLPNAKFRYFSS